MSLKLDQMLRDADVLSARIDASRARKRIVPTGNQTAIAQQLGLHARDLAEGTALSPNSRSESFQPIPPGIAETKPRFDQDAVSNVVDLKELARMLGLKAEEIAERLKADKDREAKELSLNSVETAPGYVPFCVNEIR